MVGIAPDIFWRMTPWQLHQCMAAHREKIKTSRDDSMFFAWHTAAFHRAKQMPKLKDVLQQNKKVTLPVDHAMMQFLKAYQKRREANGN